MSSQSKEKFREWVKKWGTGLCLRSQSVEEDTNLFFEQLKDGYDACFPPKKVKLKRIDVAKPWLNNDEMITRIKERNRLYVKIL